MTIKIQVLGTGCAKCTELAKNAESAAKAAGIAYALEKVTDVQQIMAFGVLSTPALVMDGKVVSSGKLLSPVEIAVFLKPAGSAAMPVATCCSSGCCCAPATETKPAVSASCDCDCTSKGGSQPCSCASGAGNAGSGCCSGGGRGSSLRLWLFPVIALAVAGVLLLKEGNKQVKPTAKPAVAVAGMPPTGELRAVKALPKLVDLGAIGCKPCKIMDGVLEELRKAYPGKLEVEFINVKTEPEKTAAYKIEIIPTQVWLDASGKELFRHEGVMEAGKIVTKFKELGVDLGIPVVQSATPGTAGESARVAAKNTGACCP